MGRRRENYRSWKVFFDDYAWMGVLLVFPLLFLIWSGIPHTPPTGNNPEGRDRNTVVSLKNAIASYYTEYRSFPAVGEDDITLETNTELMSILCGEPNDSVKLGGPRQTVFFAGRRAKYDKNGLSYDGIEPNTWVLRDSYGSPYRLRFDLDQNGEIESPKSGDLVIQESILVWSAGPDKDFATWEDNLTSW